MMTELVCRGCHEADPHVVAQVRATLFLEGAKFDPAGMTRANELLNWAEGCLA
jgi:hypothetical protein